MDIFNLIEQVISHPPVPFNPNQQTLKNWATYCLRDRGFKVVYAQNADFAIERPDGQKLYISVTQSAEDLDPSVAWIVRDEATNQIRLVAPTT